MTVSHITNGSEFRVNTYTSHNQSRPDIATLKNGGYVVTWQSYGPDGSGPTDYTQSYTLLAQRYNAKGDAVGAELQVGNAVASDYWQASPQVTGLKNGGFTIIWEADSPAGVAPASLSDIYGQIFSSDGAKVGTEMQLNTFDYQSYSSYQHSPAITTVSGGFVVAWDGYYGGGPSQNIFVQRYTNSGTLNGDVIVANTTLEQSQEEVAITTLANGGFVTTWKSYLQDGDSYGVYGQIFDATGTRVSSEFQANTATLRAQYQSSVTALDDGSFVVVWRTDDGFGISGQRFSASGTTIGAEFDVGGTRGSQKFQPDITSLKDGGMIVVWETLGGDGSGYGIYGQRFSADGTKIGESFDVNGTTTSDQKHATVVGLKNGGFVVSWQSDQQDGDAWGIYAQQYAAQTFGTANNNVMTGSKGANWIGGLDGNDNIHGKGGMDSLYGGSGKDTLFGDIGKDRLYGEEGRDRLVGGAGNDQLFGGELKDVLLGGKGQDRLNGGEGQDILSGGAGSDSFVYTTSTDSTINRADRIKDFNTGLDHLDLSALASGMSLVSKAHFSGSGPEVRISEASGNSIIRVDVDGDGSADMKILIMGTTGMDSGDFIF